MRFDDRRPGSRRLRWRSVFAGAALIAMGSAYAHHSYAMFDLKRTVIIKGKVQELQWTNPHVFVEVDVPDPKAGKQGLTHYSIESGPIAALKAAGFTRTTMKPGDPVTIVIYPFKDGRNGGMLYKVTLADGRTLRVGTGEEKKETP